jgi:hypothetical protein
MTQTVPLWEFGHCDRPSLDFLLNIDRLSTLVKIGKSPAEDAVATLTVWTGLCGKRDF